MILVLSFMIAAESGEVIRLEDMLLQGTSKRPGLIELESQNLNQRVEELALKNLIQLERELTKPEPAPENP